MHVAFNAKRTQNLVHNLESLYEFVRECTRTNKTILLEKIRHTARSHSLFSDTELLGVWNKALNFDIN